MSIATTADIKKLEDYDAKNISRLELHKIHVCSHCGEPITDRYIIRLSPSSEWHSRCLNCECCGDNLSNLTTCYMRNDNVYCKRDHQRLFAKTCAACDVILHEDEYVMKIKSYIYHVTCFRCIVCHVVLTSGDSFRLNGSKVLCKQHYDVNAATLPCEKSDRDTDYKTESNSMDFSADETISQCTPPNPSRPGTPSSSSSTANAATKEQYKPTRVRTVLSDKQVAILKTCYAANPRPDALMKEQLVELTGLSLRVIRVWFQNKRCKDKKKSVMIAKRTCVNSYMPTSLTTDSHLTNSSTFNQQRQIGNEAAIDNQWLSSITSPYSRPPIINNVEAESSHYQNYAHKPPPTIRNWYVTDNKEMETAPNLQQSPQQEVAPIHSPLNNLIEGHHYHHQQRESTSDRSDSSIKHPLDFFHDFVGVSEENRNKHISSDDSEEFNDFKSRSSAGGGCIDVVGGGWNENERETEDIIQQDGIYASFQSLCRR